MSKPIEVGCLVMVVAGLYTEFIGKVGVVVAKMRDGERYNVNSKLNLVCEKGAIWVVKFDSLITCNVKVVGRGMEVKTLDHMAFATDRLVRINGDDDSLDESECDEISRVKETV